MDHEEITVSEWGQHYLRPNRGKYTRNAAIEAPIVHADLSVDYMAFHGVIVQGWGNIAPAPPRW